MICAPASFRWAKFLNILNGCVQKANLVIGLISELARRFKTNAQKETGWLGCMATQ